MTASFLLELDTQAPVITWGSVSGTTAGELFVQLYEIDEPEVVSATLTLGDGRVLEMTVGADRLEVLLPEDTPDGTATIHALVRDEPLNEATRQQAVSLVGVVVQPVAPPPRRMLPQRPRQRIAIKRSRPSVVRVRGRGRVSRVGHSSPTSIVRVRSRGFVRRPAPARPTPRRRDIPPAPAPRAPQPIRLVGAPSVVTMISTTNVERDDRRAVALMQAEIQQLRQDAQKAEEAFLLDLL